MKKKKLAAGLLCLTLAISAFGAGAMFAGVPSMPGFPQWRLTPKPLRENRRPPPQARLTQTGGLRRTPITLWRIRPIRSVPILTSLISPI